MAPFGDGPDLGYSFELSDYVLKAAGVNMGLLANRLTVNTQGVGDRRRHDQPLGNYHKA